MARRGMAVPPRFFPLGLGLAPMEIEQALRDLIAQDPTQTASVVLCCKASAAPPEAELASRGFRVSEAQRAEDECFIYGDIALGDIEGLSDLEGIEVVSSAPEASIL